VTKYEKVHHVVHVVIFDAEIFPGQLIGLWVHDCQFEAAQPRWTDLVFHSNNLKRNTLKTGKKLQILRL
jgi:hypothetical protein